MNDVNRLSDKLVSEEHPEEEGIRSRIAVSQNSITMLQCTLQSI